MLLNGWVVLPRITAVIHNWPMFFSNADCAEQILRWLVFWVVSPSWHHSRPDDKGSKYIWNAGKILLGNTALLPRRQLLHTHRSENLKSCRLNCSVFYHLKNSVENTLFRIFVVSKLQCASSDFVVVSNITWTWLDVNYINSWMFSVRCREKSDTSFEQDVPAIG